MTTSNTSTMTTTASLYVGTYSKYNNGSIVGQWMKLNDYSDAEEFLAACVELHKDEVDPEFMFQDYEGFPARFYSESMSLGDLEKLFEALPLIEALENATDSELAEMHNTACEVLRHDDDQIYSFDDKFFEMAFADQPMKAARAASFGELNWSDDWITFDGYANLKSISDVRAEIDDDMIFEAYESDPNAFSI